MGGPKSVTTSVHTSVDSPGVTGAPDSDVRSRLLPPPTRLRVNSLKRGSLVSLDPPTVCDERPDGVGVGYGDG